MMRNETPTEIHIALNVLADMKEENPFFHRKIRRLLPALAMDFARAGRPVSERVLKAVLNEALEKGRPLESFFVNPRPGITRGRRYEDIAAPLNLWFGKGTQISLGEALAFGLTDYALENIGPRPSATLVEQYIWSAAHGGHYDLVRHFIDTSINKSYLINRAIQAAMTANNQQFHILHAIVQDYADDYSSTINTAVQTYVKSDGRSLYEAYIRLKNKYQATGSYSDDAFTGLEKWQHTAVRMSEYEKVRGMLAYEVSGICKRNQAAYKATLVFQSADRVLRYLERWGEPSKQPLKSLIDGLQAPISQAGIDWGAWGDALLKYGPDVGYLIHYAQQVKSPVYNDAGEISLRLTRDHIWKNCFPNRHKNEPLAQLVYALERTNDVFERALEIWNAQYQGDFEQPGNISIPDIRMDCTRIGLPGYTLQRMSYNDMRIMFLGDYTGCCERVGDHFEETVQHATSTGESGYFVLMKDNDIRLHSWVWRGEGGQLIIDGYETRDPNIEASHLVDLTREIARTLSHPAYEDYEITDVLLGISNQNFDLSGFFPIATEIASRFVCEWYFPEISQWLVERFKEPHEYMVLKAPEEPPKTVLAPHRRSPRYG